VLRLHSASFLVRCMRLSERILAYAETQPLFPNKEKGLFATIKAKPVLATRMLHYPQSRIDNAERFLQLYPPGSQKVRVEQMLSAIRVRDNIYPSLPIMIEDLVAATTGARFDAESRGFTLAGSTRLEEVLALLAQLHAYYATRYTALLEE
jgi:hypothetical protein